jgi:putative ABC transport system permease protein
VQNVVRVRSLPVLLAALVGAASGALLAFALAATVRNRRHDLAVLKVLGASRRQVSGAIAWQAALTMGIAAVVGLPVGVAVGRQSWRWAGGSFGTLTGPQVPVRSLLLLAVWAVAAAIVIALLPAWSAGRTPAAHALRAE